MASQQSTELSRKTDEILGQAQTKKDEYANKASDAMNGATEETQNSQNPSYTSQATSFLQQTGEQVKNMAQGAAEAVKNTLGMNSDNNPSSNPTTNIGHSSNPSPRV